MFSLVQLSYFACSKSEQLMYEKLDTPNVGLKLCCLTVLDFIKAKSIDSDTTFGLIFVIKEPHPQCIKFIQKNIAPCRKNYNSISSVAIPIQTVPKPSDTQGLMELFDSIKNKLNE